MPQEPGSLRELAIAVSRNEAPYETLRQKRDDVLTARVQAGSDSVIMKLWSRRGVRGLVRRLTNTGAPDREWFALNRLREAGLAAPRAIERFRFSGSEARHTDAVILEDLGPCERASERLQAAAKQEDWDEVDRLSRAFLDATDVLCKERFVDLDHRVTNFVVNPNANIFRLDLELSHRRSAGARGERAWGKTIGVLIGSYAFCLVPHADRVETFGAEIMNRVEPTRAAREAARSQVAWMLDDQRQRYGVDMRVELAG